MHGGSEYLGTTLAHDDERPARYLQAVREDPARVSPTFDVRDVYGDGCVLVQFLSEDLGADAALSILESDAPDFWAAVQRALGADRALLHRRFTTWLKGTERPALAPRASAVAP